MLRANRPILAFFDSIKALRVRQLALILKAGYDPNLMLNARGQNGLQFMINYFGATEAHYRLQAPINKSAYLGIAKLLLDSGLDPNAMELLTDETVLFDAIRYNDREMVALLLNYVDLALRNKDGETALMCAARFGSKQVTRLILDHLRHLEMDGYFLRQRNRFGLSALEIARAENLEAAKVLTKHLITFGQLTGAALARSASHHQLAAAGPGIDYAYRPAAGRAPRRPAPGAALLADDGCLSPSDCDSDILAPSGPLPAHRPARRAHPRAYPAYYDPRAAEFSQYLLEQQAAMSSAAELDAGWAPAAASASGPGRACPAGARLMSEEEEPAYGGAGSGQLVRSRSCMLGPASGGAPKGGVYGAETRKKSSAEPGAKLASGWQDQAGGAGQ